MEIPVTCRNLFGKEPLESVIRQEYGVDLMHFNSTYETFAENPIFAQEVLEMVFGDSPELLQTRIVLDELDLPDYADIVGKNGKGEAVWLVFRYVPNYMSLKDVQDIILMDSERVYSEVKGLKPTMAEIILSHKNKFDDGHTIHRKMLLVYGGPNKVCSCDVAFMSLE